MSALSVLAELNERLESAARAADDLEREIEESLPARRIHKERSALPADGAARRQRSSELRVLGAPKESFDVGPGAYDVVFTTLGKRVTGGKWGVNKRFRERKDQDSADTVGPGKYDPNQSFVMKKRPGVKIVAPTKKTLAAHVKAFEREEAAQGVGPGKYTPDFFATSEWASVPRVSICPDNRKPDEKLQQHLFERESLKAGQAPGAYDCWLGAGSSSSSGVLQWHPVCAAKREPEAQPGPGSYDPELSAIKGHVSQVHLAPPSEAGSRSVKSTRSERSSFLPSDGDGPGPGAYDAQDDLLHPRAPSTVLKRNETKSLKQAAQHEGDMLLLNPTDTLTKPNARCSVVMREASFASQASTEVAEDTPSKASVYDVDLSILSTKRRSLAFSMQGQSKRRELSQASEVGPGHYSPQYRVVDVEPRATSVLQSSSKRADIVNKEEGVSSASFLLDTERADRYLRAGQGAPDIRRFSARPTVVPGQVVSDFTGTEDYGTIEAERARWAHTPNVNMTKESKRQDFASKKDDDPALGPGKYDLDDSLVHPRAPSAFISSTVDPERRDADAGDALVLEPTAADGLVRRRVLAPVDMERTKGRLEPKKEPAPEALDYVTDARDRAEPGKPIPGVVGLKFDGQVGRVEPKIAGEGAHLLNQYHVDYSQVEVGAPAVDFSRGPARKSEHDAHSGEDGDVLILDPNRGHEYTRGSGKLVIDMSKQTARPDQVAGQVVSDFTGTEDYEASEAAKALHAHTATFDMGRASDRKDPTEDANRALGPGAYRVDDSLVHPRVTSAFISQTATHEEMHDFEGDELDLDPACADRLVFKNAPGPIDMAKATGRPDPRIEVGPEALDYFADSRGVVKPGEPIPGVPTLSFDGQVGRVDKQVESDGSHLHGKYDPQYSLVEASAPAWDFAKATGRRAEGDDLEDVADDGDGDVLVLHPERGYTYLQRSKLVPDIGKQAGRPEQVAGQHVSECDPIQEYAPCLDAVLPHTPVVVFDGMTGRREEKVDLEASKLGPGSYDIRDEITHARAPTIVMGQAPSADEDKELALEGDILVLHPEQADTVTRPAVPGFSNLFQPPALDTEWATKTHTCTGPDGEQVKIPSIRWHVERHRLWCELLDNRPDVYDTDEAERLTRARVYQESAVDMQRQTGHAKVKMDLGVRLGFTSEGPDALPVLRQIVTGGQVDKAQGAQQGDVLCMITTPSGKVADLRRWARPRTGNFTSNPVPKNTSRVVTQLGPWRECAVDVHAKAECDFEEDGSTFFYHIGTHKRTWTFDQWSQQSYARQMLAETLEDFGYPLTLHVRRPQSHCLIPIAVRFLDDSLSGAYNPKHQLVEAAPRGVVDLAAVAGRDLSFEAKSKYELLKSNLYFRAKRTTPSEMLISDKDLDAIHAQQLADLRCAHEERIRHLTRRQSAHHEQEMSAIRGRLEGERSMGDEDRGGEQHEQEDLFESMMQQSVLGEDIDARRQGLVEQLEQRQAAERKQLRKLIRQEEKHLLAAQLKERTILVDARELKSDVDKAVHRQRLQMDPVERLRETERQRRRRLPRTTAALHHTAEYSHGAPAGTERWLDAGKTHERLDARGLSDAEVADWKAHCDYKGLAQLDPLAKWFWQLIESWRPLKRAQVLQLATGTAAAPKGGFATLAGHDIRRPDGAYRFSLRKQQQQPRHADARAKLLPRAFAPLNRLYLPEYRSKRDLAVGLDKAIELMLGGKTADTRDKCTSMSESKVKRATARLASTPLECQHIQAPANHMFTILEDAEEEASRDEACPRCQMQVGSGLCVYHQRAMCTQVAKEGHANLAAQSLLQTSPALTVASWS